MKLKEGMVVSGTKLSLEVISAKKVRMFGYVYTVKATPHRYPKVSWIGQVGSAYISAMLIKKNERS